MSCSFFNRQTADFIFECLKISTKDDARSRTFNSGVLAYIYHDTCPVQVTSTVNII